jgi:hypothetical protein
MMVDSLVKGDGSVAAVVDTMGNFDVVGVYTGIVERLKRDGVALAGMRDVAASKEEESIEDVAARVLDRVKIMRVFDFVGVREAIAEIREDLEGRKMAKRTKEEAKQERKRSPMHHTPEPARSPKRPTPEPFTPEPLPKRTVVADSEDEDDEDDEMLFDTSTPPKEPTPSVQDPQPDQNFQPTTTISTTTTESHLHQQDSSPSKVTFILIDNLASVLTPLLKKDNLQANALASTFLQTLNHLTRTHTLYTILANPATTPRSVSPTRLQPPNQHPQENRQQAPPPPPSIFASNTSLPTLVGVLARYVDVGLLVSCLPKRKLDAKVYYRDGNGASSGVKKLRGVEMVGVVEVMCDRWEGRSGDWGVLEVKRSRAF